MNDIILISLRSEAPALANHEQVFFTGIGKINAAATAVRVIERYAPKRIINFGTAGGITVGSGLHQCTKFVQRDMHCEALGFAPGVTPFEPGSVIQVSNTGLVCSSGDDFVTNPDLQIPADVVDMEAYAIAKVCQYYNVRFDCWKYITDQADESANADWNCGIDQGQLYYINKLKELIA